MQIGVVTTSFPRFPGDPAGHFVARHVEELRRAGHDVEVIAAGDARPPSDEALHVSAVVDPPRRGSLRVTRIPSALFFDGGAPEALAGRGLRASLLPAASAAARFLAAAAPRARRWDATVAHWLVPSALAALPSRGPLLAIAHGGDLHLLRRTRLLAPTLTLLLARRARLVFVSEELAALARAALPSALLHRFDASAIVQPMGVDLAAFAGAFPGVPRPHPRRYLLTLARLVPIKGLDLAIATLAATAPELDCDLVLAGAGPERAALERQAAAAGLAGRVRFLGAIPTSARATWLAHAAAVLLPSRRLPDGRAEGMPQVALEALAAGVPLLAAATGGLAALPPPVRLLPEDDRDPQRWAEALTSLLTAPPPPTALRALAAPHAWPAVAARLHRHWFSSDRQHDSANL
jgi:glycosyltransferase involved in cell wall biosynthesis